MTCAALAARLVRRLQRAINLKLGAVSAPRLELRDLTLSTGTSTSRDEKHGNTPESMCVAGLANPPSSGGQAGVAMLIRLRNTPYNASQCLLQAGKAREHPTNSAMGQIERSRAACGRKPRRPAARAQPMHKEVEQVNTQIVMFVSA